ncbi:unnamed protein product [Nippostrongylus brasiliensis]|uniref:Tyrosine-protein phosphatase domain-containing protein n=1 Tax=Nippostrongylus brasiliensis TaxID=27835 RepID=A0A0N4YQ01_NIPBR|nr:unnamed protein product [Nippostrongylus brasiliensis]
MSQQKKEKKKINYSPDKKYKEGSSKKSPNKKSPSNQTRTSIGDFLNLNLANIPQVKEDQKRKNLNVVCNGYTRVILNDGRGSDYIHANYIRGDRLVCSFICTQGPLPSTVFDFWRMIWMEKVCHIIMLCGVSEEGKRKCEQYWPDSKGTQVICQDFVITTIKISNTDMHVTRTTLEIKQGSEKHYLKHHRWKTW